MAGIKLRGLDWAIVALTTLAGTAFCVAIAFALDYSHFMLLSEADRSAAIFNDIFIPCVLCPPFFSFLTWKIRQLEVAKKKLEELATIDSLTKVLNRGAFTERVGRGLQGLAGENAASGALLIIDVDHFKTVNDRFGHGVGDDALCLIIDLISKAAREMDLVGRLGGEEFGVFVPWVDRVGAHQIADRICHSIEAVDFRPDGEPHRLSVSIGIAMSGSNKKMAELFKAADTALYAAKHAGRNRVVEYDFINRAA
jgi:diguanylate cyclase (GGDEF)-like protein